jgi:hypothetical protein
MKQIQNLDLNKCEEIENDELYILNIVLCNINWILL